MRKELNTSKKREIEKYLSLLKQEDQKYDFQSSNLNKLESEIVRLYKKWHNVYLSQIITKRYK